MRLEYTLNGGYPEDNYLLKKMSLQNMSNASGQSLYAITVSVHAYLCSLEIILTECVKMGLHHGKNSEQLPHDHEKSKLFAVLLRQMGVTGLFYNQLRFIFVMLS
jgi:hypothetical protein